MLIKNIVLVSCAGPGSSRGKMDSLGFDSRWWRGEDFSSLLCVQTGLEVYSAPFKMGTGAFPRE